MDNVYLCVYYKHIKVIILVLSLHRVLISKNRRGGPEKLSDFCEVSQEVQLREHYSVLLTPALSRSPILATCQVKERWRSLISESH